MQQPSSLGEKVSQLRNQRGMTQKELADLCDIDIRTIQRIESGEVTPRMYTVRLLAEALEVGAGDLQTATSPVIEWPSRKIKTSWIAGILFSVNGFIVVYYLIGTNIKPAIHIPAMIIHAVTGVLFFRGFYLLGKNYGNKTLEMSSLFSMVLFPLINMLYLFRIYFPAQEDFFRASIESTLFVLLCLNDIFSGIGLLLLSGKMAGNRKINLYRFGGVIVIVPCILYLNSNVNTAAIGLLISLAGNIILTYLLYIEYKGTGKLSFNNTASAVNLPGI